MNIRRPKPLRLRAPEPSEAMIQSQIMRCLQVHGWLVVRINGGGFTDRKGQFVKNYIVQGLNACAGFPDVVAFRQDRFLLIEVKKPEGELSRAQERFHGFAARFGVLVHVLRDVEEVEDLAQTR